MILNLIIAAEYYRTPEQTFDADDYMVDGVILLKPNIDYVADRADLEDHIERIFGPVLKDFMKAIKSEAQVQAAFPKFWARVQAGTGFWFKITTKDTLDALPKDFHGNSFSEAELLGVPADSTEKFEVMFNSEGDRIESHPDKFMLSMGAI